MENEITPGLKVFIESNALGFATVGQDGKPHNIAVACLKVVDNKIVISNTHIKESIENIKNNDNVALVVWNKEWELSAMGFEFIGKAKNYTEGEWLKFVRGLPDNEGYDVASAIVVEVTQIKRLVAD